MFQISFTGPEEEKETMAPKYVEEKTQKDYELLQTTAAIRDGQRLPTPDRRAVIELSDNPDEKHHLRRQQQLLTDIALRAREQDITALSGALTKKCTLDEFDRKHEKPHQPGEAGTSSLKKYATNSSFSTLNKDGTPRMTLAEIGEEDSTVAISRENTNADTLQNIQAKPEFSRSTTFFPKRKHRRTPKQTSNWKGLPRLQIHFAKGLAPSNSSVQHTHMIKTNLIRSRNINGPIQLKHYIQPKDALAPLILPRIENASDTNIDSVDTFMQASQMNMKQRSRTVYDGFMVSKPPVMYSRSGGTAMINKGSSTSRDTGGGGGDAAWVTQSMATLSIAPSTSPTPLSQTARAKTVLSRVSYS